MDNCSFFLFFGVSPVVSAVASACTSAPGSESTRGASSASAWARPTASAWARPWASAWAHLSASAKALATDRESASARACRSASGSEASRASASAWTTARSSAQGPEKTSDPYLVQASAVPSARASEWAYKCTFHHPGGRFEVASSSHSLAHKLVWQKARKGEQRSEVAPRKRPPYALKNN